MSYMEIKPNQPLSLMTLTTSLQSYWQSSCYKPLAEICAKQYGMYHVFKNEKTYILGINAEENAKEAAEWLEKFQDSFLKILNQNLSQEDIQQHVPIHILSEIYNYTSKLDPDATIADPLLTICPKITELNDIHKVEQFRYFLEALSKLPGEEKVKAQEALDALNK